MSQDDQGDLDCFGKPEFFEDGNDPACRGGPDPAYINPRTGLRMHDRCDEYDNCKRMVHQKLAQISIKPESKFITPKTHPPQTSAPRQWKKPAVPPRAKQSQPVYQMPTEHSRPATPHQQIPQPPAPAPYDPNKVFPGVYHPLQVLMPQESQPFLTVPETMDPNVPFWKRLLAGASRAAAKGVLSHGAYVADHLPIFWDPSDKDNK